MIKNYIANHWRGENTLAYAYWVNGLIVSGSLTYLLILAGNAITETSKDSLRLTSVFTICFLAIPLVISTWSLVGIWRSAGKRDAQNAMSGWGVLARIAVVIGVIQTGNLYLKNIGPQMIEMGKLAAGYDSMGRIKVILLDDKKTLMISGELGMGSYDIFRAIFEASPGVTHVALDSGGGRNREAMNIANLIKTAGLNTYVEGRCLSFCTLLFLSGKERAATPQAKIGFHSPSFPGLTPEQKRIMRQETEETFRNAGLKDSFIKRIIATPYEDMWYPTRDELVREGVITRVSLGGESMLAFSQVTSKEQAEEMLFNIELYQLYERRFPGIVAEIATVLMDGKAKGKADDAIATEMRAIIGSKQAALLWTADQAVRAKMMDLYIDQLLAAKALSPHACALLLQGRLNIVQALPKTLYEREMAIVSEALKGPEYPAKGDQQTGQKLLVELIEKMPSSHVDMLTGEKAPETDIPTYCDANISFYKQIGALPDPERAEVINAIYGAAASPEGTGRN